MNHPSDRSQRQLCEPPRRFNRAYVGSIVLGLNDALVEFTGALAGFSFALESTRLVAFTGSITGIAAALSMAASEYLSTRSCPICKKSPHRAALCTGISYLLTVSLLILPFLITRRAEVALGLMLATALGVIATFCYLHAKLCGEPFSRRFIEMVTVSFGVAALSFLIGCLLKQL